MTPQEIKEQVIRMEGLADGIKFGATSFAQWVVKRLSDEEAARAKANQGGAPEVKPEGH